MKALAKSECLASRVEAGKAALKGEHRPLIKEGKRCKVASSMDFEAAVDGLLPQQRRWDHLLECSAMPDSLVAVEVHAFDVSALVAKKAGTLAILRQECPDAIPAISSWHVVAKGSVPRADLLSRFYADTRITVGRVLDLRKG